MKTGSRRAFLKTGMLAAGGIGLGLAAYYGLRDQGVAPAVHPALGPLRPVRDENTGLPLLMLPDGFRYHTFAWAGETMSDGFPGPARCDGMGVTGADESLVTLVRNHELRGSSGPMGDPHNAWDNTGGGTTTLLFDTSRESLQEVFISLNGTLNNCAGGVTPWGSWLSCEEVVYTPELAHLGIEMRQQWWGMGNARRAHGYVFEVEARGVKDPQPLWDMGQFNHEAATVDPNTGIVYMTEDSEPFSGLYRYIPSVPGRLGAGGKLQMMRVEGHPELTHKVRIPAGVSVAWVDIDEPGRGHSPGSHDGRGVANQGLQGGATAFVALEGCNWSDGRVFFTSKNGGAARAGAIFSLDADQSSLQLVYESTGFNGFSGPDNINISPRGSLVICEDREGGNLLGQQLAGLNAAGELFAFSRINPAISGQLYGHDLAATAAISEWAGVCFSPDGQWLFVNVYLPGFSCAVTGPWVQGLI